ncbi:MAG: hypothetical protein AAF587_25245 [Bacteroidota bacterium]
MKSDIEIKQMFLSEICEHVEKLDSQIELVYYNDLLEDTSFLLAAFLERLLIKNASEWDDDKWVDDCLLTKVLFSDKRLQIWGVMIWGRLDISSQWTDPFYFDFTLDLSCCKMKNSTFLFRDMNIPSISYEQFNISRGFWDKDFFSDNQWDPYERTWKLVISSDVE